MNKFIIIFTLILNSFVFGQVKDTIIDGKKKKFILALTKMLNSQKVLKFLKN